MAKIKFTSLHCQRKQDVTGKDEPRILVDGDSIWTGVIEKGQTVNLTPLQAEFDDEVSLSLREMNGSNYKSLGTITVKEGQKTPQPAVFKTSGAHYELYFTLV